MTIGLSSYLVTTNQPITIYLVGDSTMANYADNYDKGKDYLLSEIDRLNKLNQIKVHEGEWEYTSPDFGKLASDVIMSSNKVYSNLLGNGKPDGALVVEFLGDKGHKVDLEGQFKTPTKTEIQDNFWFNFRRMYHSFKKLEPEPTIF